MDNPFDLTGTAVVVTGSSRGIGLAIARVLLRQGAAVLVNGLHRHLIFCTCRSIFPEQRCGHGT